jgi:hypothetical protein
MPRADLKAERAAFLELVVLTRPSFSTARRKRLWTSATLDKPLIRECLFYPCHRYLWTPSGQWLVCRADASPTEDPDAVVL